MTSKLGIEKISIFIHPVTRPKKSLTTLMMQFNYQDYLNRLSDVEKKHAPKELHFEGDPQLLLLGIRVSVVGSRKPSPEGIKRAEIFTKALVNQNITVVSGLAEGIDTVAHQTAIKEGGKTIAVLGTPLDVAYPKKNKTLLDQIKKDHLAISQFPKGYPSSSQNFPMRNRTMALISDATVIVEASEKSGTRHQGWEALRLGRLVFIMQNVIDDPSLTWPQEMINYGAQVLNRKDLPDILFDIPSFTSSASFELSF
jgi:DNA processing protein